MKKIGMSHEEYSELLKKEVQDNNKPNLDLIDSFKQTKEVTRKDETKKSTTTFLKNNDNMTRFDWVVFFIILGIINFFIELIFGGIAFVGPILLILVNYGIFCFLSFSKDINPNLKAFAQAVLIVSVITIVFGFVVYIFIST